MTERHAYLIICHKNFKQLALLLKLIDHQANDIYIHIDKKVRNAPYSELNNAVKKAGLYFTKRVKVTWGGYSQIKAELVLLRASIKNNYSYYHLLSEACMPLHTQEYIHNFFMQNKGKEFMRVENISGADNKYLRARLKTYHFFQEYIGRNKQRNLFTIVDKKHQKIQNRFGVNRIKESFEYYYGDNWFSITNDLAHYLVSNFRKINRYMKHSICADEIFMQTLTMMSPYKENIVGHCARLIDWNRGRPYVFKNTDFEELISSDKIFARKFDKDVDEEIIINIYNYLTTESYDVY